MQKTRCYPTDVLYRSATLAERIRHYKVEESKSAADGMEGKPDSEGVGALIRTLPQVEAGVRTNER